MKCFETDMTSGNWNGTTTTLWP